VEKGYHAFGKSLVSGCCLVVVRLVFAADEASTFVSLLPQSRFAIVRVVV